MPVLLFEHLMIGGSAVVEGIFKPLIEDIGRMVDDQVNLVQKKRLAEGHEKGADIKVMHVGTLSIPPRR